MLSREHRFKATRRFFRFFRTLDAVCVVSGMSGAVRRVLGTYTQLWWRRVVGGFTTEKSGVASDLEKKKLVFSLHRSKRARTLWWPGARCRSTMKNDQIRMMKYDQETMSTGSTGFPTCSIVHGRWTSSSAKRGSGVYYQSSPVQ